MAEPVNKISSISSVSNSQGAKKAHSSNESTSFKNILENSINEVNRYQQEANDAVSDLASGKTDDLSKVMIAVKKSDLAFTALMETRNKLVDAYNEIMRMRF